MLYVRYKLFFLTLTLFGITLFAYSQDITEQSDTEQDFWGSLFWILLISLVALIILAAVVYFIYQVVQQWRTIHNTSQNLPAILQSVQRISNDTASRLQKIENTQFSVLSQQEKIESDIEKTNDCINDINVTLTNLKTNIETDNDEEQTLIDYQREAEREVKEAQEQAENLARAYEDGEPIDFVDIQNPIPSQKVLLILNSMAYDLGKWKTELEQSDTVDPEFFQIIISAEKDIKNKLQSIRGESSPTPIPLAMDTPVRTDAELNWSRDQCIAHVARFEGVLSGYELGHEVNEAEYDQFIPQFIRYRLFNEMADFVSFEDLPEKMDKFLRFLNYEVVPIEIGKTKADAHVHEIRESRHTRSEPGTIVEIISPGLRRTIGDREIVQKPVVVRGE